MAQATRSNITRRSLALVAIAAAGGAVAPAGAAGTAVAALWPEHERLRSALDLAVDDKAVEAANAALWSLDDRLMLTPAACLADLDIKARVLGARTLLGSETHVPYVEQLIGDIAAVARLNSMFDKSSFAEA